MRVALIGSPLSGKTTILKMFQNRNIPVFHTDKYINEVLYKKGNEGYELIKKVFGKDFVNDVEVDRKALRIELIKNPNKIELLNNTIHPLVAKYLDGKDNFVAEIPIIVFTKTNIPFDKRILVKATKEEIIKRLNKKSLFSDTSFIETQIEKWNNIKDADIIIDTTNGVTQNTIDNLIKTYNLISKNEINKK